MVSRSALRSFESMVAAASAASDDPQAEQNRPVEETFAPQEEQNIEGPDSTIGGWLAAN